ncbi:TetR/AcrR family transcriptional regulator [Blastococcus sp. SYSU D00813]
MDGVTGLRERKKAETRAALAAATLRLTGELGWAAVTVERIAAEADVSYRTFFNHFASKEEALLQPQEAEPGRFARLLAEQDARLSPLEAARRVLRAELAEAAVDAAGLRLRMAVVGTDTGLLARAVETAATGEREMTAALAARCGQDAERDLYPALLTAVLCAAVRVALTRWAAAGEAPDEAPAGAHDLPALLDEAVDLLGRGFPAPVPHG